MSWITLNEDDIESRLSGPELAAYKTTALASGQGDPVPEIIAQVTAEVRGHVAACAKNSLDADLTTLPAKLESAALDVIAYRLLTRLPRAVSEDRKDAMRAATRLFERVAACQFAIDTTDNPATDETATGGNVSVLRSRPRKASGGQLNGL